MRACRHLTLLGNEQHTTCAADLLTGFLSPGQDVSDFVRSLVRRDARARLDDPANATRNGADGSGGGGGDTDLGAYQPTGRHTPGSTNTRARVVAIPGESYAEEAVNRIGARLRAVDGAIRTLVSEHQHELLTQAAHTSQLKGEVAGVVSRVAAVSRCTLLAAHAMATPQPAPTNGHHPRR